MFLSVFIILFLRRSLRVFLPPCCHSPALTVDEPVVLLEGTGVGRGVEGLEGTGLAFLDATGVDVLERICSTACCSCSFRSSSCCSRLCIKTGLFEPIAFEKAAGNSVDQKCFLKELQKLILLYRDNLIDVINLFFCNRNATQVEKKPEPPRMLVKSPMRPNEIYARLMKQTDRRHNTLVFSNKPI